MFPAILEVIISLVVVYFLMSTLVSFLNEFIAMVINSRGKILEKSLKHLFVEDEEEGDALVAKIYQSKFVNNLAAKFSIAARLNKKPSYIATENFTSALIDEIQKVGVKKSYAHTFDGLKKKIDALKDSFIKTKLEEIVIELEETQHANITTLKKRISEWFDSYMLTVTEVYKNYVRVWIFSISFFVVFSMNIDSLVLIEYFFENKEKRELMVSFAEKAKENDYAIPDSIKGEEREEAIRKAKSKLMKDFNAFDLPYGWIKKAKDTTKAKVANVEKDGMINRTLKHEQQILNNPVQSSYFTKFLGLLMTTVSLTLGAPFWYQLMMNLLALRKSTTAEPTKKQSA